MGVLHEWGCCFKQVLFTCLTYVCGASFCIELFKGAVQKACIWKALEDSSPIWSNVSNQSFVPTSQMKYKTTDAFGHEG